MVCIYCNSKTHIINSRFNKETLSTWRRHKCQRCNSVFTTYENIDLSLSIKVTRKSGILDPFNQNKLLLSLCEVLNHKKDVVNSADIVKKAVLREIYKLKSLPIISTKDIFRITTKILKRYDATALVKYLSTKEEMQKSSEVKRALNIK